MQIISMIISLPISILLLIWMIRIKKKNPYPKYSFVKMLIGGALAMIIAAFVGFLVSLIITMVRVGPSKLFRCDKKRVAWKSCASSAIHTSGAWLLARLL